MDELNSGALPFFVMTPRWGDPFQYAVSFEGNAIVLKGGAVIVGPTSPVGTYDAWTGFRLTPSSTNSGVASFEAVGREVINQGDDSWTATVRAKGVVRQDTIAPEVRTENSSIGPPDTLLPWDTVTLHAAEGVKELASAVIATAPADKGGDGDEVAMYWQERYDYDLLQYLGAIHVIGRRETWDPIPGSSMLLSSNALLVQDVAGNTLAPPFASKLKVLDVGKVVPAYTFDGAAAPVPGSWGTVTYYGKTTGSDPLCAKGGCVMLGPFDNGDCVGRIGIAGRLQARSRYLTVRYRVLSSEMSDGSDVPFPFTLQTVANGDEVNEHGIQLPYFHDAGTAAGELRFVSDDITERFESPAENAEIGFVVYAGDASRLDCSGPPIFQGAKTAVVIDYIGF
jgi:hypothetical protein